MMRFVVLLAVLLPTSTLAQSGASTSLCPPLPPTVQASTLGPVSEHGTGFYRVDGAAPSPRSGAATTLELELGGAGRIRRGQALNLSLRVTNRSGGDITVMRAMDGSAEHMRDPSYDLYLREVGSGVVYRWDSYGARCGMTNAVAAADYVRITPGAVDSTLPGEWGAHLSSATVPERGHYEAWVVYRLCGDIGDVVPGTSSTAPTPGAYSSNAFRFHVR